MSPAEYGADLATRTPAITDEQAREFAQILIASAEPVAA